MTQYGFFFDSTRCTGCRTCEMACKDYKDLSATIAFRKVYDYEGGAWSDAGDGTFTSDAFAYHVSLGCQHCAMPACMAKCPQGAIEKDTKTGLVHINQEKCTGVGACVETCPYNVPIVDKALGKGVKCDGCAERVAAGEKPVCVEACPARALDFGPADEMAKLGERANIAPLPDASGRCGIEAYSIAARAKRGFPDQTFRSETSRKSQKERTRRLRQSVIP